VQSLPPAVFADEPEAHARYNRMREALLAAQSLYYQGEYSFGRLDGSFRQSCVYTMWLKKPNFVRLEASYKGRGDAARGILVGDGETFWKYWPTGRPQWNSEAQSGKLEEYEKTRHTSYMKHAAPQGRHSISHDAGNLGAGICMLIVEPSTFHGYTDSMQSFIEAVRSLGTEKVGDEECDVIEVSVMKGQRSWTMWLSKTDHLPRKLMEFVRVSYTLMAQEQWSNIVINGEIPDDMFKWSPPEGWTQYAHPDPNDLLLKPGSAAPEFDLAATDGGRIKLSGYLGKVVWMNVWRAG
jgi:outer membrane lipoprotein-sorting protein